MNLTGFEEQGPIRTGAPIIDYGVALAASFAISSALFKRSQTGKGSFIDVSMLETAYTLMSSTVVDYLITGNEPKQRGNAANSKSPAAGSFACKDGLISLGINEEHQFVALAKMLKKEKLMMMMMMKITILKMIYQQLTILNWIDNLKKNMLIN